MADVGFAMLNSVVSIEPFTLVADVNPGVSSINHKIMLVRNYHAGKDPNNVWFKFMVRISSWLTKNMDEFFY